jgi:hypothetical protein
MALRVIALTTKNLQVVLVRTPTYGIGLDMVYFKTLDFLTVTLTIAHEPTPHASVGISFIDLFSHFNWNKFPLPTSQSSLSVQHVFGAFSLFNVNN